jgi:transposase
VAVPNTTIHNYVKRFRATGSKENTEKRHAEEKLNETDARLKKKMARLAEQAGMSASSARNAVKLLHLHLRKATVVQKLRDT